MRRIASPRLGRLLGTLLGAVIAFATLGDQEKGITYTAERVWYTVIGVVIGVLAILVLNRWDRAAGDLPAESTA